MIILKLMSITKKIKNDRKIFDNISIEFRDSKIYAITGINGCGKSLLLKIISGFTLPTSGKIVVETNLNRETTIRFLIEKPTFISDISGYENLIILDKLNQISNKKMIEKLMMKFSLNDMKNDKYYTYSLGMKQKLGIIQTIFESPDIILLDEPFNGIDKKSITAIKKELQFLKNQGKIIIITTHSNEDIEDFCDHIYLIEDGKIK